MKIEGTKFSTSDQLLLISSGIPSLDDLLYSGGIPVGSIVLIRQDGGGYDSRYANLLVRYFLSQGLAIPSQHLVISSEQSDVDEFINSQLLHATRISVDALNTASSTSSSGSQDKAKIAWRYQQQQQQGIQQKSTQRSSFIPRGGSSNNINTEATPKTESPFCSVFDLQRSADKSAIETCKSNGRLHIISNTNSKDYKQLFNSLSNTLQQIHANNPMAIARLALLNVGSPTNKEFNDNAAFIRFLVSLKGLIRYTMATVMITVPQYLWTSETVRSADIALELKPFKNDCNSSIMSEEEKAIGREYNGWFVVRRVVPLNTIACKSVGTSKLKQTLAFKCRRRKFCIEPFHLPPDLSDPSLKDRPESQSSMNDNSQSGGCGSADGESSNKLSW